jgi:hypothetical protein
MNDLTVHLWNDTQADTVQLTWYRGSLYLGKYSVDRGPLDDSTKKARGVLQELVDERRLGNNDPAALRSVAKAGHELYVALFLGSQQPDRDQAAIVKERIARTPPDTITFIVPSAIHVPWGLVYDNRQDWDDKNSFWCLKYNVGAYYDLMTALGVETEWSAKDLPILFGAHKAVWDAARDKLCDGEKAHLQQLLEPVGQPKFCRDDLIGIWRSQHQPAPFGLLSFYCHASGQALCIGNETISHNAFARDFARGESVDRPPTLVFLAGCQTAIGDLHPGFLGATSKPGFCGFIGTEVKVPDVFTLGFLSRFIERFYGGGGSIEEVMHEMRLEHWPLSLVFSMCCARELRLAHAAAMPVTQWPAARGPRNLCDHRIASG